MALSTPDMVLLDLDGTLVDSVPDLAWSLNRTLAIIGLPGHELERIRGWIGLGIEHLIRCALAGGPGAGPDPSLFERALPVFLEVYGENACVHSHCYPGVQEGIDLGCVTNKRAQFAESILKKLGLLDDFGIVVAGDTLPKRKPDPMPLLHAARHFHVAPENALMIGDSCKDVEAARAAGFQVLCVTYGYNFGRDIRDAGPDAVVDSLAELPSLI